VTGSGRSSNLGLTALGSWVRAAALAAALLAGSPSAQAQLLGIEQYFASPKIEYSADVTITGDGDTIKGTINHAANKERRELAVEGDVEVMIIRLDRRLVWSLSPEEKLYIESTLDQALGRPLGPDGKPIQPKLRIEREGEESVDGQHAMKQQVSGKDADGTPIDGTVWVTDQGIVVRVDSTVVDDDGTHHQVRMELTNLKVAPQDPKLFEIPAGFKRVKPPKDSGD
jgi:hypothetical protein